MERSDPGYKGQSGYNPVMLAIYDVWVLKLVGPRVLKTSIPANVELYREHLGQRHLDVGPGTGYFIQHARPPAGIRITLLDPNPHVLKKASKRLASYAPESIEADVMKPLPVEGPYDSAALSFVLHCLRGPMPKKGTAIRNIADVLTPDGTLFGGAVLGPTATSTRPQRAFLKAANKQGAFDNLEDTANGLREILDASFRDVEVEVSGSSALFSASGPRR
jgi:ubiquinone/menaquinone biosynthesis C-methylase UbiE